MPSLLIKNGRVVDPSQQLDKLTNILVESGHIVSCEAPEAGYDEVIDATGKIVTPGLVDVHTELREPGCEEDETIESGTAAALAGGYTSVACIPNTEPPIDTQAGVEFVRQKAARAKNCNVFVLACVSKNREGDELAEIGSLVESGAVGFTDAERPIHSPELMRRALEYCLMFNVPILNHPEVLDLSHDGIMHEGHTSMVLGLKGMPADAEDVMTARDLRLAEYTGGRLHLMNISSAGSVELIRRYKARDVEVTAEVCPAHFCLTDETLRTFDPNCKTNPPLRSRHHVDACIAGLVDGTIDIIASCHAPRASEKKLQELDRAPFGMVQLETTLALVNTYLIRAGHLDWPTAIAKMTVHPAQALNLSKGTLKVGSEADITIIDPDVQWTVSPSEFCSRSGNTPFAGQTLQGRAIRVLVGGETRYQWPTEHHN